MDRRISTALSDLVLALSALWGFRMLSENQTADFQFGKWWFMLMIIAASLGVARFGALLPNYETGIVKYHMIFSWLCRAIGVPCLAAEVCKYYKFTTAGQGFLLSAVATFITSSLRSQHKEKVTELINGLSVIMILVLGITAGNAWLIATSVLFVLSGMVGVEGEIQSLKVPRVDVFHYILVAINYCIVWGFEK
ncbi:uncharacterized protein LOC122254906 [Penaeus japonicus]|uniref:uncharacterized protein LOC122254906 n=1 Tax=Penaeus japonicus TaxID=27405 RepID=UPI001C710704|nr:uncharacterized protein LOC122254906 [Penaeus japonicus]XP_042874698.1 uncharacterized protein LOC122254906 [Penaeus japonicus]